MRIDRWITAAAVLVSAGAPLHAQDATGKPAKPTPKMICRSERVTGSMVQIERNCATQQEWSKLEDDTQNVLDANNRRWRHAGPGDVGMQQNPSGGFPIPAQ